MKDILQEIVAHKRIELAEQLSCVSLQQLANSVDALPISRLSMRQSLAQSATGIISEFKRRSPSKGWIKQDADASVIPVGYEQAGASALSILTDQQYFGGSLNDIVTARPTVNIPILRKDFIIDEYQLYQARCVGANAVLLIAACLTQQACANLAATAHQLGLETLLEIHSEAELDYVDDNIDMVGVNNRNLGTFHTDVANSYRLAQKLPTDKLLVSESGISSVQTIRELREAGFRGFLIGETFMKTPCPSDTLNQYITQLQS